MDENSCDTLVIGAGIIGIATAYSLKKADADQDVVLVDMGQPMAWTSAQSGENYRNWWPHPVMTAFTDHSIDLMERIAEESDNRIAMSRRGYALASRSADLGGMMGELSAGYGQAGEDGIRLHAPGTAGTYQPPTEEDWRAAPCGVDVLTDQALIQKTFPSFEQDIRSVVHIRRAGAISGQQMGQIMLERFRDAGGRRMTGKVVRIEQKHGFHVSIAGFDGFLQCARIVNAAGPFINEIAGMLGSSLPVKNVLQQKIAFEDVGRVIPRGMPFSIDLDAQLIDWSGEERELLASDPELAWSAGEMPGSIHCRPDGGDRGTWVKLGWAFNGDEAEARLDPALSDTFPEIVLRGAARLNPGLKAYYGRLPRGMRHYGGYYTMTAENWPLIGPMDVEGAYVVGAMSGFGTMAACAAGELCARWICGGELPEYAGPLSLQRYGDVDLMAELGLLSRGVL